MLQNLILYIYMYIEENQLDKTAAYLTKYAVLFISSCLERCVKDIILDDLFCNCNKHVCTFIENTLNNRTFNPKSSTIKRLLAQIDPKLPDKLNQDKFIKEARVMYFIDQLVNNRNSIAHGSYTQTTLSQVRRYFYCVIIFLRRLHHYLKCE